MTHLGAARARNRLPLAGPGPTAELLSHADTVALPAEIAGLPPTRRRQPAHRRLEKARRISDAVATSVERFCLDWEMVEGGAQEPGSGGDEARTREEVIAGAVWRLAQARARITDAELDLVLASCVLCLPAWEVAVAAGIADPPIDDFGIDRWRRAAREALDDALIPVLYRLAGVPSETRA